jgi:hypothetical protein
MGFNKKILSKAVSELGKAKAPAKPRDITVDPKGYWNPANQGQPVRVPGNGDPKGVNITMGSDPETGQPVPYPVWAQPNVGPGVAMQQGQDYNFPNASYVDETPIAKKGGTLQSKKYSKSMSATNKLFTKNKLFQNKKSKIFDPNAQFKTGGSKLGTINLNPNPLSHYELNYGFNLPTKEDGGEADYEDFDLTDKEIQAYRDGGYIVEELPEHEIGGFVQHELVKAKGGRIIEPPIKGGPFKGIDPPTENIFKRPDNWNNIPQGVMTVYSHPDMINTALSLNTILSPDIYNKIKKTDRDALRRLQKGFWGIDPATGTMYTLPKEGLPTASLPHNKMNYRDAIYDDKENLITDNDIVPKGYERENVLYTAGRNPKTGKVTEKEEFVYRPLPTRLNSMSFPEVKRPEQQIIPAPPYKKPVHYAGPRYGTQAGDENLGLSDDATQEQIAAARRNKSATDFQQKNLEYQEQEKTKINSRLKPASLTENFRQGGILDKAQGGKTVYSGPKFGLVGPSTPKNNGSPLLPKQDLIKKYQQEVDKAKAAKIAEAKRIKQKAIAKQKAGWQQAMDQSSLKARNSNPDNLGPQSAGSADWVWTLPILGPAAAEAMGSVGAMSVPGMASVPGATVGNAANAAFIANSLYNTPKNVGDWYDVSQGKKNWKDAALGTAEIAAGLIGTGSGAGFKSVAQDVTQGTKTAVNYGKDLAYASKEAKRLKLPTYEPVTRWDPDNIPYGLEKAGRDLTEEQQALTGSWYSYKPKGDTSYESTIGFYPTNRPGPGNVNHLRLSEREIANLENSMSESAKGMSGKSQSVTASSDFQKGELNLPQELRNRAKTIRFDVNPSEYIPQSFNTEARSNFGMGTTGKHVADLVNAQYPKIMGIPRKYFPEIGSSNIYNNVKPKVNIFENAGSNLNAGISPQLIKNFIGPKNKVGANILDKAYFSPYFQKLTNKISPLNLIKGYGKSLEGVVKPLGNVIGRSIKDGHLVEPKSLFGKKGVNRVVTTGLDEKNASNIYAAAFDGSVPGSQLRLGKANAQGFVGRNFRKPTYNLQDLTRQNLSKVDILDPGVSLHRKLPFSIKHVPIDKQKLLNNEFQWSTTGAGLQNAAEKYGKSAVAGAAVSGAAGAYNYNYDNPYLYLPEADADVLIKENAVASPELIPSKAEIFGKTAASSIESPGHFFSDPYMLRTIGEQFQEEQDGGYVDSWEDDLDDEEIRLLEKGGYIVERL